MRAQRMTLNVTDSDNNFLYGCEMRSVLLVLKGPAVNQPLKFGFN